MDATDPLSSYFDHIFRSTGTVPKRQPRKAPRKPKSKHPPPPRPSPSLFPIVVEDGLILRVITSAEVPVPLPEADDYLAIRAIQIENFRTTFVRVWNRIPRGDRRKILDYWKDWRIWLLSDGPEDLPSPHPVIRLVLGSACVTAHLDHGGHVLNFPASVVETTDAAATIASCLAEVFQRAAGPFWRQYLKIVVEPIDEWESQYPEATDKMIQRREATAVRRFLQKHTAAVAELMARWGFELPRRPGSDI